MADAILPSAAPSEVGAARALVGRLVRGGVAPELLTLIDGPLAAAVATAADYAGQAITAKRVATYKADWTDFIRWARAGR